MAEHSVAEIIGEPISLLLKAKSYHLAGSGREDADVRMLGTGRPFYIQFNDCKEAPPLDEDLDKIQNSINSTSSLVNVKKLQTVSDSDIDIIKSSSSEKNKTYSCLLWVSQELSQDSIERIKEYSKKELKIQQKTPVRVLHNRSPLTREKTIYSMSLEHIKKNFYVLQLTTEAGTYIKEFVHGDLGRTVPNFSSLTNTDSQILELDVLDVDLNFPPNKKN
ncbi:hypothetical protein BB560_000630 [Smittium megazygosporum]|uniref:tRNA pseudouridine(55) synthase n=1 Tax=Smittium megazygosporum TaxID=133381 RepID=A0A2T9ZHJ9_9FUNG|nr:hypothetical protein BB560_001516 [Smittium megazygosporum]PVV04852.1 hypothetical protein BB560_000630 [Smittium megazygosporum]